MTYPSCPPPSHTASHADPKPQARDSMFPDHWGCSNKWFWIHFEFILASVELLESQSGLNGLFWNQRYLKNE